MSVVKSFNDIKPSATRNLPFLLVFAVVGKYRVVIPFDYWKFKKTRVY